VSAAQRRRSCAHWQPPGARAALAEVAELGGTCVNVGCIPKKLYSYRGRTMRIVHERRVGSDVRASAPRHGVLESGSTAAQPRSGRLNEYLPCACLEGPGVTLLPLLGHAGRRAHGPRSMASHYTARHLIVATGGMPYVPQFVGPRARGGVGRDVRSRTLSEAPWW